MQVNSRKIYIDRITKLVDNLQDNACVLLQSNTLQHRNGDVHFPFRQCSDVIYFTGCHEADTYWAFYKQDGELKVVMGCKAADPIKMQWIGAWTTPENACDKYAITTALTIQDWQQHVLEKLSHFSQVLINQQHTYHDWSWLLPSVQSASKTTLACVASAVAHLRMTKDAHEVALIKQACDISSRAHVAVMQNIARFKYEYEIEACFFSVGRSLGATALAYPTIAATGAHACILHYDRNDGLIDQQSLCLIDAGMEWMGYAADISRTFPTNGQFSSQQKDLYEVVLAAQVQAISQTKPGVSWADLEYRCRQTLLAGCRDLGLFSSSEISCIDHPDFKALFPHSLGHHIGLDVHDVLPPDLNRQQINLAQGHVITIEPGIYCADHIPTLDKKWHGIGIRIEDDILITSNEHEVLTAAAPKTVQAIESLME